MSERFGTVIVNGGESHSITVPALGSVVRVELQAGFDLTSWMLPDGRSAGEKYQLYWLQPPAGGVVVSGPSANVALMSAFSPDPTANAVTLLHLTWDSIDKLWREVSRSNEASDAGPGAGTYGGGGDFVESVTLDDEGKISALTIATAGGGANYQTVQEGGVDKTQEPKLNFNGTDFDLTDSAAVSTNVALAVQTGTAGTWDSVTANSKGVITAASSTWTTLVFTATTSDGALTTIGNFTIPDNKITTIWATVSGSDTPITAVASNLIITRGFYRAGGAPTAQGAATVMTAMTASTDAGLASDGVDGIDVKVQGLALTTVTWRVVIQYQSNP